MAQFFAILLKHQVEERLPSSGTAAGESGDSFLHLHMRVIGTSVDVKDFDRRLTLMSRRLGTSVSETARLVDYSQPAVVSTSAKWMHAGEISS